MNAACTYRKSLLCLLASLAMLFGCRHEDDEALTGQGEAMVSVLVPATRAVPDVIGTGTAPATADERCITSLWLMAYPEDGSGGQTVVSLLNTPELDAEPTYRSFTRRMKFGTYRVYVVANIPELSETTTEAELKSIVLSYKNGGTEKLPALYGVNGSHGLPMLWQQTGVTISETQRQIVADLEFVCVKVRCTLLFDNEVENSLGTKPFAGLGLQIDGVEAVNIASQTMLCTPATDGSSTQTLWSKALPAAERVYYDYPAGDSNDALTGSGTGKTRWACQFTCYLPEHYVTAANQAQQTGLTLTARLCVAGTGAPTSAVATYTIELGDERPFAGVRNLPRGTYYDIRGIIKDRQNMKLETTLTVSPWTVKTTQFTLEQTALWVSATQVSVTSLTTGSVNYTTTAPTLGISVLPVDGREVVTAEHDAENGLIRFALNEGIPYTDFGMGAGQIPPTGTVKVMVTANNLQKYIDVAYDATPFLEVSPRELLIAYDPIEPATNTKMVTYRTNLGGITFAGGATTRTLTSPDGGSTITLTCPSNTNSSGAFTVTANNNPGSTVVYEVDVYPVLTAYQSSHARKVRITVKPPVGDYRIYFRMINDKTDTEYYASSSGDWDNGWGTPKIYIYTQLGESTGNEIPATVWNFAGGYGTTSMTADNNNPGWYYYTLGKDLEVNVKDKGYFSKKPKPGETLIMFMKDGNSFIRHRYPFHMEPGVPLFDYEDREGWIVYDPTVDTYEFYDEKPEVQTLTYTVYTRSPLTEWYRNYGVSNNLGGQYTLKQNSGFANTYVSGWYRNTISLQSIVSNPAKNINLNMGATFLGALFGAADFSAAGNTGYYDAGVWTPGTPP